MLHYILPASSQEATVSDLASVCEVVHARQVHGHLEPRLTEGTASTCDVSRRYFPHLHVSFLLIPRVN